MAEVIPTRMELLKTKDRITLARKGHKLLKQKRDALILEFFKILKEAKDLRGELTRMMGGAYGSIFYAEAYHPPLELENIILTCRRDISLDIEVKNIMGVRIPAIKTEMGGSQRMYSVTGSTAKIDNAVDNFERVLEMVIKLAETETAIKRLIMEIEKTKRRVNALEYVLLPKLTHQMHEITFRLEELERDSFVSLKTIKRKLEKEKRAKAG